MVVTLEARFHIESPLLAFSLCTTNMIFAKKWTTCLCVCVCVCQCIQEGRSGYSPLPLGGPPGLLCLEPTISKAGPVDEFRKFMQNCLQNCIHS